MEVDSILSFQMLVDSKRKENCCSGMLQVKNKGKKGIFSREGQQHKGMERRFYLP